MSASSMPDRGGTPDAEAGARGGHTVHPCLVRPVLYLGVERPVIAFEATLALAVVFGVGLHLITLGLIGVVMLVIHPSMVWATAKDAQATEVYIRSRAYADYYAPHGSAWTRGRRPRPSIPGVR
jgi:type IV secretory pathway TrbD component